MPGIHRKGKKSPKRLGRPQPNKKVLVDRMIQLLKSYRKTLPDNPQSQRRLDFGNDLLVKNHVLPKPEIITPKKEEKIHRMADEVVCDDGDLENINRLGKSFAKLNVKIKSEPKPEEDYMLMNLFEDEDDEFLKACLRSAKKIGIPKVFKSEAALLIKQKSESEFLNTNKPKTPENKPEEAPEIVVPESRAVSILIGKDLAEKVPKLLEEKLENPEISSKPLEEMPDKKTANIETVLKLAEIKTVPKSADENPTKLFIGHKPHEIKSEKFEVLPTPAKKTAENLKIISLPTEKDPEVLKKPDNLQVVSKPEQKTAENTKIVPELAKIKSENPKIVPKTEKKTLENPKIVPKPAEKKPDNPKIVSNTVEKKPDNPKIVTKPTDIKSKNKDSKQKECNHKGKSMKDFRFSATQNNKGGNYNRNFNNLPYKIPTCNLPKRNIIVDGSNVAFSHGMNSFFSSEGLQYCLQYFHNMGHCVKAVVPLFRRNAFQSSNPQLLENLYNMGMIVFSPCKNFAGQKFCSYDDRFVLQIAYEWNGAIVSNDNYRDLLNESLVFHWIVSNRVLSYTWCNNSFMLAMDPYGRQGPSLNEILHF